MDCRWALGIRGLSTQEDGTMPRTCHWWHSNDTHQLMESWILVTFPAAAWENFAVSPSLSHWNTRHRMYWRNVSPDAWILNVLRAGIHRGCFPMRCKHDSSCFFFWGGACEKVAYASLAATMAVSSQTSVRLKKTERQMCRKNTAGVQVTAQTIDTCSHSRRFIIPPCVRIKQSPPACLLLPYDGWSPERFPRAFTFWNPPPAPRANTQKHTFNTSISCAQAQRWDRYVHT